MEVTEAGPHAAFGVGGKPEFWIGKGKASTARVHVAFATPDHATVRKFYEAALAARARDNGPPGLRPEYHPTYYGAFVLDADPQHRGSQPQAGVSRLTSWARPVGRWAAG
jgi:hypothetical protein